jgi:ribosomal protein S18 acetylase RimI-like enzyme
VPDEPPHPEPAPLTEEELAFLHGMFDLAREGDVDLLCAHVDAGLPVDLTNSSGDTLLVLAAYHRHADLVRALLERGADHARVNDRGQTALGAAVFRQDTEAVTALLAAGADPTLGRQSALATATVFDLPEMRALLSRSRLLVRPATGDDLAAVEEVVREAYEKYVERIGRRPVPMDSDYKALVGQQRVWVADDGGHVVGILVLEEAADHLLVENVAVSPRAQRRGIGRLLLAHADDRARAGELTEVRLYTHESMTENLAYYPRRGFRETHRESQDGRRRVFFTKVLASDPST